MVVARAITMRIKLYPHQEEAIEKLRTGSILCGGVGSGKSRTAIAYFFKQCGGRLYDEIPHVCFPKDLYIITTARKRDTLEWDKEFSIFSLSKDPDCSLGGIRVTVDSWNNIAKYEEVSNAFFIFDEQRVVGYGAWTKSFLKITRSNEWILLSATPGDTWTDYIPVFIANGFYKNKTEFTRRHCVYDRFAKYPKIDRYLETGILSKHRDSILVNMPYRKDTNHNVKVIKVGYDKELMDSVIKRRWDPFMNNPIKNASEYCYISRRIANTDLSRLDEVKKILADKKRVIIFYNFDYELHILRTLSDLAEVAEWNGHKHEQIPKSDSWAYLVQYTAGAEGWNCIETDTIIFYSQNYSYKIMLQSSGRIDRLNTPYSDLYYYVLRCSAPIDISVSRALKGKKSFNEASFINFKAPLP